jgi:hypothetical protein
MKNQKCEGVRGNTGAEGRRVQMKSKIKNQK